MSSERLWLVGLALALVLSGGCERKVPTKVDSGFDVDNVPVPSGLQAKVGDASVLLDWSVKPEDSADITRFIVYRTDSIDAAPRRVDSIMWPPYLDTGLANGVVYGYAVTVRNTGGVEGRRSSAITARPAFMSVQINDDSSFTSRTDVRLRLTAAGAALMRLANDTVQPGAWRAFEPTTSWTVPSGLGPKRVFAQFQFSGGSAALGWVFDDITLDDRTEIIAVNLTDSVLSPGDSLIITAAMGESGGSATYSLAGRSGQKMFDDGTGGDTLQNDRVHTAIYRATAAALFEQQSVTVTFRDAAGNVASQTADWKVSVREAPAPPEWVSILSVLDDPLALNLTWTGVVTQSFSQLLLRRSQTPGQGVLAPVVRIFTSSSSTTYRDTELVSGTTYYYTLEIILTNGQSALSVERSGTTAIDVPPDPVTLLPPADVSYDGVSLQWSQSSASDFAGYRLHRSTSPQVTVDSHLVVSSSSRTFTSFSDTTVMASTPYYYQVYVLDFGGQVTGSNVVRVDIPANEAPRAVLVAVEPTADSSLSLSWTRSVDADFETYRVFRAQTAGQLSGVPSDSLLVRIIPTVSETSYQEAGMTRFYYYRVFVYDRGGLFTGSNTVWGPKDFGP